MLAFDPLSHQIHTPSFDGPLELLLFLIRRKGVDIRFVEIAPITDAYLHYIKELQALELDLAGDFLLMAATLCYLKSCELLPNEAPAEEADEDDDPIQIRERLAQRLLEYQAFQDASQQLKNRPLLDRDVFTRPELEIERSAPPTTNIDSFGLLHIYRKLLEKNPDPEHRIGKEPFSLRKMGDWIVRKLEKKECSLQSLFQYFPERQERIICFLTTLELAKHHIIHIFQVNFLGNIQISANFKKRPSLEHIFTEEESY